MRVALENCLLIDGVGTRPRPGMTVVVDGPSIVGVSERFVEGADISRIDLENRAVMPGLIDCHIHFALWSFDLLSHVDRPLAYLGATTLRSLRETLEHGCTTARDPGGLDVGYRDAIADGISAGPRLQTSITIISPTNGIADSTKAQGIPPIYPPGMPSPECNGPDDVRRKVRELVRAGADFVKLAVSGGVSSPRRSPHHRMFTEGEIAAIVDEAHAWDLPVAAHAIGGPGPLAAIRAGVDTIEHGVFLDDECVEEMAARGTWYVPTFAGYEWHELHGDSLQQRHAIEIRAAHRESFARARNAGVRIASGSDAGVYNHDFSRELELLVEAGMTPSEAVLTATASAAECLGLKDRVGRVEEGLTADLLVVDGDPTRDVGLLRPGGTIECVLQAGRVVVDRPGLFSFASGSAPRGERALRPAGASPV